MEHAREMFQIYFEKFATTTVIRVFNFIRTSAFFVERLFWLVVLVGFSCTTVWSVTQTFKTFGSEPTASRVSFLSNISTNMTFPDAIICVQVRSHILLHHYEQRFGKIADVISKADFPRTLQNKLAAFHQLEEERIATMLERAHQLANETKEAAGEEFNKFHQAMKQNFTDDEVGLIGLTAAMFIQLTDLELRGKRTNKQGGLSPIHLKLHQAYVHRGTNFSELFLLTAELLCSVLQLRLGAYQLVVESTKNPFTAVNFCKDFTSPAYAGHDLTGSEVFCYRLTNASNPPITFFSSFDYVVLTAHHERLYNKTNETVNVIIDLDGKWTIEQQLPIVVDFKQKQTVRFSIETVSTLANLRRRGCWEKTYGTIAGTTTQAECTMWCNVEVLQWV